MKEDKRKKKKKALRSGFSEYYNFYFDLTKRLKIRMSENRQNFKFRKNISYINSGTRSKTPKKTEVSPARPIKGKTSVKKRKKKTPTMSALLETETPMEIVLEDKQEVY